ncbi:MAG: metallophosphoesterase family protein, partial [Candidatus Brocadiaceae bacterium]|nr:metallophosphoesterase family protein [Candidatus Brocadiaceae bacterium]
MKYVIVSDIHGNVDALLAVIKEIAERENPIDNLLIAGDIVGYGASPNECCDIVRFFMYGRKKVDLEIISKIIDQPYLDSTQKENLLKAIISLEKKG